MFEDVDLRIPPGPTPGEMVAHALARDPDLHGLAMLAGVEPTALDPDGRVDLIVGIERGISWLTAVQQYAIAALDAPMPDGSPTPAMRAAAKFAGAKGLSSDHDDWNRDELAVALHLSGVAAQSRLDVARDLLTRLPGALAALERGELTHRKATILSEATQCLDQVHMGEVEARVLPAAAAQTPAEFRKAVRRAVIAADPAGATERREQAAADRELRKQPGEDGMAELWARLPAEDAETIWHAATLRAEQTRGEEDARTLAARRADALCDFATAYLTGTPIFAPGLRPACSCHGEGSGESAAQGTGTPGGTGAARTGGGAGVQVIVPIDVLLGLSNAPGEMVGYGPIDADTARRIAADEDATWRRLLTDPATGQLLHYGHTVYRPPAPLARHLIARDRVCAFPGCTVPARRCDLDHAVPYDKDGNTDPENMGALCRRHHRLKTMGIIKITRHPDQTWTWTSPAGKTYHCRPPTYLSG